MRKKIVVRSGDRVKVGSGQHSEDPSPVKALVS
jgi:hypothetical protein